MSVINWGILGAAKFAREQMGPAIHAADGARLTALATTSEEKAAPFTALAPDLTVHRSYEALLADPTVDAVYIPLPHTMHIEWSRRALAAGKHVLSEKPIGLSADAIAPLIADRDASGLLATEAYMIVHHQQWHRARTLLCDGALGTLHHVTGVFTYNNPDPTNIRNQAATGGGSLPDIGVYTIGSTRWVTGAEPSSLVSVQMTFENGVEVSTHAIAQFPGFTADWLTSMRLAPQQEMTFHGDSGWMRLTAPFNPRVFGEARIELRAGGQEWVERFPREDQYKLQVEAFGAAIQGGPAFPWTLEDARATQKIIDQLYARGIDQ